jgi:hypothetical protein
MMTDPGPRRNINSVAVIVRPRSKTKKALAASYYLQRASEVASCRYGVHQTLSDWRGGSSGWVAGR